MANELSKSDELNADDIDGLLDEDTDIQKPLDENSRSGGFFSTFNRLDLVRQIGLLIGLAASISIGIAIVMWSQGENYQPLYGSADGFDSSEVIEVLDLHDINYQIEPKSGLLLIPVKDVQRARLKLAAAGISSDKSTGYEIMDGEQSMGTSQFMELTKFKRGLEGELARTITSLHNIRHARVHLAIPKKSVFVRNARKPRASVFIATYAGKELGKEQVKSIINLVAFSIPDLTEEYVRVVDQKGRLLSNFDDKTDLDIAGKQLEHKRKIEDLLSGRINSILQPVLGDDSYRAEVSADVDFTVVQQTDEMYNPDLPALRSEQVLDERRVGDPLDTGIPGSLSNQPPLNSSTPEVVNDINGNNQTIPSSDRKQSTRNYELDRTLSYTQHQQGRIKRISVAVAVDDIKSVNAETKQVSRTPWTEDELLRVEQLVKNAVGFNAERGDSVNVINTSFKAIDEVYEEPAFWNQPWFWVNIKQAVGMLLILFLILGVLRPVFKNLIGIGNENKELAMAGTTELETLEEDIGAINKDIEEDSVTLSAGDEILLPAPNESYEKQLNAIRGLVADDPGRVAQVVKQWIAADE